MASLAFAPRWTHVALALLLTHGCVKVPAHCTGATACDSGLECLANRCVTPRRDAVAPSAARRVLQPIQLRVSSSDAAVNAGLPSSVTFGGRLEIDQQLYVRFEPGWADLDITSAFLVLAPHPYTEPQPAGVRLRVARIPSAWNSVSAPKTAHPTVEATATGIWGAPLRIDVTHTLRYAQSQSGQSYGFALSALDTRVPGVTYSTGVGVGEAPYLEVYGNPRGEH